MFTSESVTEGHPDKLCDQISDAIVDRFLQQDACSSIIAECAVSTAIAFIAARFASHATIDISQVVRQVITQVGYDQPEFSGNTCSIVTSLRELPSNERRDFNEEELTEKEIDKIAVKNQVTLFGFACPANPGVYSPSHLSRAPLGPEINLGESPKYSLVSGSGRKNPGRHRI